VPLILLRGTFKKMNTIILHKVIIAIGILYTFVVIGYAVWLYKKVKDGKE
jgi:hypothetical protein